jgi:hypothetical protein
VELTLTKGMETGCCEMTTFYHSTSNAPKHYKCPLYASLHTGSSQMARAAARARARIYCCGITSRTVACVQATLLLRTRSRPAVELVWVPDIVTTLNGPMCVHSTEARWTGFEETTWREGEDLPMELCFALHKPRSSTIPLLPRSC